MRLMAESKILYETGRERAEKDSDWIVVARLSRVKRRSRVSPDAGTDKSKVCKLPAIRGPFGCVLTRHQAVSPYWTVLG